MKAHWNCRFDDCCQRGAAECWKCGSFRMKMDPVPAPVIGQGFAEPDPNLPTSTVAWLETRLDELKAEANYTRTKLQQHITASVKKWKQDYTY